MSKLNSDFTIPVKGGTLTLTDTEARALFEKLKTRYEPNRVYDQPWGDRHPWMPRPDEDMPKPRRIMPDRPRYTMSAETRRR